MRSDIRSSFGTASGVATGVPLTIVLKVLDTKRSARPLKDAAVYIWHCDSSGRYSLYSSGAAEENYLRGVQATGDSGEVRFSSIFPAAYSGRWPHIHFEVYPTVAAATSASDRLRTSQIALPESACAAVYAESGYAGSAENLAQTSLATDMVFSDGYSLQLATVTGNLNEGYVAKLNIPV